MDIGTVVIYSSLVWMAKVTITNAQKDVPCYHPNNSSVVVILQEEHTVRSANFSDVRDTNYLDSMQLLQVYNNVLTNTNETLTANMSCSGARFMTSFLRNEAVLVRSHSPGGASRTVCSELYADYVAKAIIALQVHLPAGKLIVIYSESSAAYVQAMDHHYGDTSFAAAERWYVSENLADGDYPGLEQAIGPDPGGFILMAGTNNRKIIDWARSRNLLLKYHAWIVVSTEDTDLWTKVLIPGERVILLDTSTREQDCFVTSHTYDTYLTRDLIRSLKPAGSPAPLSNVKFDLWTMSMATESLQKAGNWSHVHGLKQEQPDIWKLKAFARKHFTIASLPWPVFHDTMEVNGKTQWHGICIEILESLASSLNFSYTIVIPEDRKWGALEADGKWNGMVGMVKRGEVDFAVAKFTITQIRDSVADYTVPFWHEPAVMVMRKPEENSLYVYMGPFTFELWLSILFAVPLMGVAILAVAILRVAIDDGYHILKRISIFKHAYVTIWFSYGALVQQGCYWLPSSQAVRFLVGFWWFFCLVITATYTGNLIAVLAVPKTILPVDSLQELANQNFYKYGVVGQSAIYSMFKRSASKVYSQMWNKSVQYQDNLVTNHKEGLATVANENYIYLGELGGVAPIVYNNCIYAMGKEFFFPSSFAFVFPENSPYLPFIDEKMNVLVENGMIEKWRTMYYPRDMCSAADGTHKPDPATIKDTQGAYILLGLGICTALFILCIEYVYLRLCVWRRRRVCARNSNQPITREYIIPEFKLWR